jgi:hypothetical protein
MPERFEPNVFDPATTWLTKSALEAALLKCKPSRADENQTRTLLASAIIDLVNAGEGGWIESSITQLRPTRSLRTSRSQPREPIRGAACSEFGRAAPRPCG